MQEDNDLEKTNKKGHMYLLILFILMMREMSKKEKVELSDLEIVENRISRDIRLAILFVLLTINAYLWSFYTRLGLSFAVDPGDWGTFGDFVGGLLNPTFALLAFYWLTSSIRLQLKELQETRKQIQESTVAQQDTAKHQQEIAILDAENVATQNRIAELQEKNLASQLDASSLQRQQIATQNFEGLFFQLLKTKTEATNDILVGNESILIDLCIDNQYVRAQIQNMTSKSHSKVEGKESIKSHIVLFKKYSKVNWESFYTKAILDYAGSYFRVCYQIVKIIDQNKMFENLPKVKGKMYCLEQKAYFDIFRSTLTQHELEAFFFNCLSKYGSGKFKKMIEKYGLFEPLLIDFNAFGENMHRTTKYAYQYDRSVFENNINFFEYFKDIKKLILINENKLFEDIKFLFENNYIEFLNSEVKNSSYDPVGEIEIWNEYNNNLLFLHRYNYSLEGVKERFENSIKYFKNNILEAQDKIENIENVMKEKNLDEGNTISEEKDLKYNVEIISKNRNSLAQYEGVIYFNEIITLVKYGINFREFRSYYKDKVILRRYLFDYLNYTVIKSDIKELKRLDVELLQKN